MAHQVDRALTLAEWRTAVVVAFWPHITALEDELFTTIDILHPAGADTLQRWLGEAKEAASHGEVDQVERLLSAVRNRLDLERVWAVAS